MHMLCLHAAVAARAFKREACSFEDSALQAQPCMPRQPQQPPALEQASSQPLNEQFCPTHSPAGFVKGAHDALIRDSHVATHSIAGKGQNSSSQKGGAGRSFRRSYVPLKSRPVEYSIEERLRKHGMVQTDKGFQKQEES
jgi:hypothetical protein